MEIKTEQNVAAKMDIRTGTTGSGQNNILILGLMKYIVMNACMDGWVGGIQIIEYIMASKMDVHNRQ